MGFDSTFGLTQPTSQGTPTGTLVTTIPFSGGSFIPRRNSYPPSHLLSSGFGPFGPQPSTFCSAYVYCLGRASDQVVLRPPLEMLTCCLRSFVYPSVLGPHSRTPSFQGTLTGVLTCFLRTLVYHPKGPFRIVILQGPLSPCLRSAYVALCTTLRVPSGESSSGDP